MNPSPAPSMSSAQALVHYPPWWVSLLVVVLVTALLFAGVKQVLKNAEEKRVCMAKNLKRLKKRIKQQDEFSKAHGYNYDLVLVFTIHEANDKATDYQRKYSVRKVVTRLCEAGLQTSMFFSVQQDEVYCKVRATPLRLQTEAERINHKMPLDAASLMCICDRGRLQEGWAPLRFKELNRANQLTAFSGLYASYNKERAGAQDIPFMTHEEGAFRNVDRIKLIVSIMEASPSCQGAGFKIKDLVHNKACLAIFPLTDSLSLVALQRSWLSFCGPPTKHLVKDYFGEKIALYFVWLGHYTSWLMGPSLVGFFCWVAISADGNDPDAPSVPYFTVFMSLWASFYLESWKREEKSVALEWGMISFEDEEQSRPEFEAIAFYRESPVTGKQEKFFPAAKRYPVLAYSAAISATFIITVSAAIIGIYIFRAFLSSPAPWGKVYLGDGNGDDDESFALGSIIGSAINAVQIIIMNAAYERVAIKLTNAENHRTETSYEDALIAKTFSFQFVNSFTSLFYVAFIKTPLAIHGLAGEIRCYPNCFAELNSTLGIIIISNIVAGNAGEIIPPIIQTRLKARSESKGMMLGDSVVKLTDVERQFCAPEYDVLMGTFKDYGEMVIQFGYCTMFVAAFPLAPVLALVNNVIELRVDAWKLCQVHRRPFPVGAEDIGTWYQFLELMSTLAVITNMALFAFTGSQLKNWSWKERIAFFVVMEHALLAVKILVAVALPDVPESVSDHLQREKYLLSKIVDNVADDVEDDEYEINSMIDLSVKLTDFVPALDKQIIRSLA